MGLGASESDLKRLAKTAQQLAAAVAVTMNAVTEAFDTIAKAINESPDIKNLLESLNKVYREYEPVEPWDKPFPPLKTRPIPPARISSQVMSKKILKHQAPYMYRNYRKKVVK